jgi:hypothetical protein
MNLSPNKEVVVSFFIRREPSPWPNGGRIFISYHTVKLSPHSGGRIAIISRTRLSSLPVESKERVFFRTGVVFSFLLHRRQACRPILLGRISIPTIQKTVLLILRGSYFESLPQREQPFLPLRERYPHPKEVIC